MGPVSRIPKTAPGAKAKLAGGVLLLASGLALAPLSVAASTPAVSVPAEYEGSQAAEQSAQQVASALEALAGQSPKPDRTQLRSAFESAGFEAAAVEVSADITPTGLAVDSIRAAAPADGSCVFGEVRDGSVSVTVLPVLASGLCFLGDER